MLTIVQVPLAYVRTEHGNILIDVLSEFSPEYSLTTYELDYYYRGKTLNQLLQANRGLTKVSQKWLDPSAAQDWLNVRPESILVELDESLLDAVRHFKTIYQGTLPAYFLIKQQKLALIRVTQASEPWLYKWETFTLDYQATTTLRTRLNTKPNNVSIITSIELQEKLHFNRYPVLQEFLAPDLNQFEQAMFRYAPERIPNISRLKPETIKDQPAVEVHVPLNPKDLDKGITELSQTTLEQLKIAVSLLAPDTIQNYVNQLIRLDLTGTKSLNQKTITYNKLDRLYRKLVHAISRHNRKQERTKLFKTLPEPITPEPIVPVVYNLQQYAPAGNYQYYQNANFSGGRYPI